MKTHMTQANNNLIVSSETGLVSISRIVESINFRINKHYEYIKKDKLNLIENLDSDIILVEISLMIKERYVKIGELKEFLKYSLNQ